MSTTLDWGSLAAVVSALCGVINTAFLIYDHARIK